VGGVRPLRRRQFPRLKGNRMEGARIVRLLQDARNRQFRSVRRQAGRASWVPHAEHRGRHQGCAEGVKALLLSIGPAKSGLRAAQTGERRGQRGKITDEATVVVGQTDEPANVGAGFRPGPLADGRELARVHSDTVFRNNMPQERYGRPPELAFADLGVELMVTQRFEDHAHVDQVLCLRPREDENVVHVHLDELAQHGTAKPVRAWPATARLVKGQHRATENGMHVAHEERRHAVEAERTNAKLVLAARHPERGFVLVFDADAKLVVGAGQVKLREIACPTSLVDQLINMRERFHRTLSYGVEASEVLTESPAAICLPREDNRCGVGSPGRHDPSVVQEKGNLLAALIQLALGKALHRARTGHWMIPGVDPKLKLRSPVRG